MPMGWRGAARLRLLGLAVALAGAVYGDPGATASAARPERIPWVEPARTVRLASTARFRPVRLQSGAFAGAGDLTANLAAAIAPRPEALAVHVLVQFAGVPGPAERERLEAAGVVLLGYVPEGAWFASVRRAADLSAAAASGLRWLGAIYAEDKLAPTLAAGTPGGWALEPDGQLRLRVRPFEDVSWPAVRSALARVGVASPDLPTVTGEVQIRVAADAIRTLAALDELRWIEEGSPPLTTFNDGLRTNLLAEELAAPPYGLTGAGVVVGIWDAGWLDFDHPDFAGRAFPGEASVAEPRHFHSTHVAGILGGSGAASEANGGQPRQWRGVAPGTTLISYDISTGPLVEEHGEARARHGAVLSQNSWGITVSEFFGNCHLLGDYTGNAPDYDRLVTGLFGAPYHVVFAAGNARGRRDTSGCPSDGYGTIGVPATAKDVVSVGAIHSDDNTMTVFSGWGPTDDGRVKPEIVAAGDEVGGDGGITSAQPGGIYGALVGTSMAAPAVSGAAALLIEDYRALFNGQTPLPATIKGLLVHTAADLDDDTDWFNPGPDFASGYGRVQARAAVDQLRGGGFLVGVVGQAGAAHHALEVPSGAAQVKVTLVWDDVPALENAAQTLVNDLDLVVTDPLGNRHSPWTLDPAVPAAAAVRDRPDRVNVLEQVVVDTGVVPGEWTVTVGGTRVPSGPQKFTLIFSPAGIPTTPLLVLEGARLEDTGGGDADCQLDPVEEITETIVLRHTDGPGATNVTAWLATDSAHVRLLEPAAAYPDILPGTTATNRSPYRYRVSKEAGCGEEFEFQHITAVGDLRFTNRFTRVVGGLELTNVASRVFGATDVPLPLADLAVTTSVLPVALHATVLDVNVAVRLDHTWLDDLRVQLRATDGTLCTLMPSLVHFGEDLGRGDCGPGVEWTQFDDAAALGLAGGGAPFVGSWQPFQPLAGLTNRPMAGNWELVVTDASQEDTGTLRCWQLEIAYAQFGYRCEVYNRPPIAPDLDAFTWYERPGWLSLPAVDPDEDPLTYRILTLPAHGTLDGLDPAMGTVWYTPEPGYHGPDGFTYEAGDGYAPATTGTVHLDVRPPSADLTVTQTVAPTLPRHDQPFTVSVTVINQGPNDAVGVLLTNLLPHGVEVQGIALSQGSAAVQGREVACDLGFIPVEGGATLILTLRAPVPGGFTNAASVGSGVVEILPADNAAAFRFAVQPTADLRLTFQPGADPTPVGRPLTNRIAVTNAGPYTASNVVLRTELPSGTAFVSATTSRGAWSHADGLAEAALGELAPGDFADLELVLEPGATGLLTVTAGVSGAEPDPVPEDNVASGSTTVRGLTDLRLAWWPSPTLAGVGRSFTNVVTLTNLGPMTAQAAQVHVQLADGTELIRATPSLSSAVPGPGGVEWTVGELTPAAGAELELVLRAAAPGWLTNRAVVGAFEFDATPADNAGEIAVEIRSERDLGVTLVPPAGRLVLGQVTRYSFAITNAGPAPASMVRLMHTVPELLAARSATATQGAVDIVGSVLIADLGDLAAGSAAEVSLEFESVAVGPFTARAEVGAFEVDPVPENNVTEGELVVELPVDLGLTMLALEDSLPSGGEAVFTLVATNHGPHAATGVRVANDLPEGLELTQARASQGDAVPVPTGVVFAFGDLAPGATATGWVHAVTTRLGGFTNTASVLGDQPDLEPANNRAQASVAVYPAPDLVVQQRLPAGVIVLDREFVLVLAITNRGAHAASNVRLTDTLPVAVELLGIDAPASAVRIVGRTLTIDLGELPAGGGAEFRLTLLAIQVGEFPNTVVATADEEDREPADNISRLTLPVGVDADLAVRCEGSPADPLVDDPISLVLTVTNRGPFVATDVVLNGVFPPALELTDLTASQGEWTVTEGGWVARLGEMRVGAAVAVTLAFLPTASGVFTNQVVVSAAQPDVVPGDNTCESVAEVRPTARLALSAAPPWDPAALGEPLRLHLSVTNSGPERASNVQVHGQVAAGLALDAVTPSQGDWEYAAPDLRWHAGGLAPGEGATLEVVLIPGVLGLVTNQFSVSAAGGDPDPADDRVEIISSIRRAADLALRLERSGASLIRGALSWYTFVLENRGPAAATAVQFHHVVPALLTLESLGTSAGQAERLGDRVSWELGELGAGATATLQLTVLPQAAGAAESPATVTAFETDRHPADNAIVIPFEVFDEADLGVSQAVAPAELFLGGEAEFVLTVTNRGPHRAAAVVLTDQLPAGVTLLSVVASQGAVATNEAGLVIELGPLEAAAVATATLRVQVTGLGPQTNVAGVSAGPLDPVGDDNTAVAVLTVLSGADLQVTQTIADLPVYLGFPVRCAVQVTNAGPNTATGVRVGNTLPLDVELLGVGVAEGTYTLEGRELVYEPGDIPAGGSVRMILDFRSPAAGWITNLVTVTMAERDPVPDNNRSTLPVEVFLAADLGLLLVAPPSPVGVGETLEFQLTVTNRGPHTATGVQLRQELPGGASLVGVVLSQGTWQYVGDTLEFALGDLPPGASAQVHLELVPEGPGLLGLTAEVTAAESDLQPGDNVAGVELDAQNGADLEVQLGADADELIAGRELAGTLVVTNHGPDPAVGVTVTDLLPPGTQILSVEGMPGTWVAGTDGFAAELGILAPGAGATASFVLRAYQPGTFTNTVRAQSFNLDPVPANNQASLSTRVYAEATLAITHEPVSGPVLLNLPFVMTVLVTNRGDVAAPRTRMLVAFSLDADLFDAEFDGGSVSVAPPGVVCQLGEFAPGASARLAIPLRGTRPGPRVSQATILSPAADPADPALSSRLEVEIVDTPALNATREGNRLVLSWPTVAAEFDLQFREDAASGDWQWSQNPKLIIGDQVTVNVKLSSPTRFYRLLKPEPGQRGP